MNGRMLAGASLAAGAVLAVAATISFAWEGSAPANVSGISTGIASSLREFTTGPARATGEAMATPTSCAMPVAPGVQQLVVGESGGFDVELSECFDVAGVAFQLNFDASIIRVDDRSGVPAFPTDCAVQVDTIDNGAGLLDFACVTAPVSGSNGGGEVAHYDVTCLSEGISPLSLKETELVDSLIRLIPHAVQDALFACVSSGVTPLPTDTQTPIQTPSDPPTATATIANTPTIKATSTVTSMPAETATPTSAATPTDTPILTSTPTPTDTPNPTNTPTPGQPVGDVSCDGVVDAIDAALILQYAADLIDSLPCAEAGDVNGDGAADALDALLVLQYGAGLIDSLPP